MNYMTICIRYCGNLDAFNQSLGVGICRQVLQHGGDVLVAARSLSKAQELAELLGPRAQALECNVSDEQSCCLAFVFLSTETPN